MVSLEATGVPPESSAHVFTWYILNVELTSFARTINVCPFGESLAGIMMIPSAPKSGPLTVVDRLLTYPTKTG